MRIIITVAIVFVAFVYYKMSALNTVVVIGGGLAGLSAAIEAHANGAQVILIEKEARIGGNSIKASSGINAVEPLNDDTVELFEEDTMLSGGGLSDQELVHKLVTESQDAVEWLINQSNHTLDLSLVSRCGGHRVGRTHRCKPGEKGPVPVGWAIIETLKKQLKGIEIKTGTRVLELLQDSTGKVTGVRVVTDGEEQKIDAEAVILASGGFGGQTGEVQGDGKESLLHHYAPQLVNLATTNGPWANGDGVRLGLAAGAMLKDMDQVQIHPTGFIDPSNPSAPTKFLAPEALRAYGAIMVDGNGHRFVDELGRRDQVSKALFDHPNHPNPDGWMAKSLLAATDADKQTSASRSAVAYLVMPQEAVEHFGEGTLGFYFQKGFFVKAAGTAKLAELLAVPQDTLEAEFEEYDGHQDPHKTVFPCDLMPSKDTLYWVALVTPCVHYTMGGLAIDSHARVLESLGKPIKGLYAAGEVTAGVHGKNRLAGNSLLECVVYGRTAGKTAATSLSLD
ncbi:FAD binding domain-containing protein [Phycomyces nitens]|nr:FAD binding domain-containing protein [Phycomyces nitens]